jgi:hypothetical protein
MNTTDILSLIDAEIASLKQARALLDSTSADIIKKGPGRPAKSIAAAPKSRKKSKMSPEGRARIAAAQKKRWAAQKKTAK